MASLEADFLFRIEIKIQNVDAIGELAKGTRSIGGGPGRVEGPVIKGEVELTDWFLVRSDGAGEVDVRGMIRTGDGALIYLYYTGLLDGRKDGSVSIGGRCPIRTAVRFETSAKAYADLNFTQGVGIGVADFDAGTVSYDIYALK
jgi:Protein of unknown function (DUF3237)